METIGSKRGVLVWCHLVSSPSTRHTFNPQHVLTYLNTIIHVPLPTYPACGPQASGNVCWFWGGVTRKSTPRPLYPSCCLVLASSLRYPMCLVPSRVLQSAHPRQAPPGHLWLSEMTVEDLMGCTAFDGWSHKAPRSP